MGSSWNEKQQLETPLPSIQARRDQPYSLQSIAEFVVVVIGGLGMSEYPGLSNSRPRFIVES
jgi:hypothetical protein